MLFSVFFFNILLKSTLEVNFYIFFVDYLGNFDNDFLEILLWLDCKIFLLEVFFPIDSKDFYLFVERLDYESKEFEDAGKSS